MSKKAVIATGGKQYMVAEGQTLTVESLKQTGKAISFEALLAIDGDSIKIGAPTVAGVTVTAEIINPDVRADKVTSIRYKAKKRVHTVKGHRQHLTEIKITKIA